VNAGTAPLRERLERVRERVERATERSGRPPGAVRLVAVTKGVPAAQVAAALALGVADLGENRVQEARDKVAALGRGAARWHLVGHLQGNKAGRALELFDRLHSLDSAELARALSERASATGRPALPVLVEVNVAGEAAKHGVTPDGAEALVAAVRGLPGLVVDGLMTVGPRVERPDEARPAFARLRGLRDAIAAALGCPLPELSMGMSGDFEAAIAEGATMVRLGTAIFGSAREA
jgi:PLP dependent protein